MQHIKTCEKTEMCNMLNNTTHLFLSWLHQNWKLYIVITKIVAKKKEPYNLIPTKIKHQDQLYWLQSKLLEELGLEMEIVMKCWSVKN